MKAATNPPKKNTMQAIKSKDTKFEVILRKALWHKGYRYRKNYSAIPGSPDIVLTKYKIAIFCDGEFFHGKEWEKELRPRLEKGKNPDFWIGKITRNIERDNSIDKELEFQEWTVIRFWGNDIMKNLDECVRTIEEIIFNKKYINNRYVINPYSLK